MLFRYKHYFVSVGKVYTNFLFIRYFKGHYIEYYFTQHPDCFFSRHSFTFYIGLASGYNVTKGFGFITRDTGEDVFVHYRSVRGNGRRTLREGQRVMFMVVDGDKGLQAEDVSVED